MARKPKLGVNSHINGVLVVNKPLNMVSKDVSRWLERKYGKLKIGHVGTLDPLASGVLVILLGTYTKLQDYLLDEIKRYYFELKLGFATTTLDLDGEIVSEKKVANISKAQIITTMQKFSGNIEQTPPLYSAVKYKGRPLYDYARNSQADLIDFNKLKRIVHITKFEFVSFKDSTIALRVECSKGTYIRTLGCDLANCLGELATVTKLAREAASGVDVQDAFSLEEIESKDKESQNLKDFIIDIDDLKLALFKIPTTSVERSKLKNGFAICFTIAEIMFKLGSKDKTQLKNATVVLLVDEHNSSFAFASFSVNNDEVLIKIKRSFK